VVLIAWEHARTGGGNGQAARGRLPESSALSHLVSPALLDGPAEIRMIGPGHEATSETELWALGGIVVVATVLPFIRRSWWWVRVCDFPRLQLFVVGLAVLAALLVLRPESGAG
jgi:hypothetical protein